MATIYSNGIVVTKRAAYTNKTTTYYALSQDTTCPDKTEFTEEQKEITLDWPYLWAYTETFYSDGNSSSSTPTIISKYGRGEPAVGAILSSESVILPCNRSGIINGTDFNVSISVVQVYEDVSTPFTLADTLTKGTYNFSFSANSISNLIQSGVAIVGQDGTQMTADTAYVYVTIKYMDLYGTTGTIDKTINIVRSVDSATVEGVYTSIDNTKDSIGLSVYKDGDGNTSFKLAGVEVGSSKSDKGYVKLEGDSILMEGSVTAESIDVDSVFAQEIVIQDDYKDGEGLSHSGSIRSAAYTKDGENTTNSDGFYLNSKGTLKAVNADFTNIKINGGEIQGDDNPLNTRQTDEAGNSYEGKAGISGYKKKSDVYNYANTNANTIYDLDLIVGDVSYSKLTFNGNTYQVANLQPEVYTSFSLKNSWQTDSSIYAYITLNINDGNALSAPKVITVNFAYLPMYQLLSDGTQRYIRSEYDGYRINFSDGTSDSSNMGDGFVGRLVRYSSPDDVQRITETITVPAGAVSLTFRTQRVSSYDWCDSAVWTASDNSRFDFTLKESLSGVIIKKGSTVSYLSTFFSGLSDYLYQPAWSGTSFDSLGSYDDYSSFGGLSLKTKSGDTYTYSDYSTAFLVNVTGITINGSAVSGDAVCSFTGTEISITQSGTTLLYLTTQSCVLTSAYPTFSFTAIAQDRGVYVDDLYPRLDSNKNYKGAGNLGGLGQEFNNLYANHVHTSDIPHDVKFGTGSKVIVGQDNESGYVNIYNVDQGSSAILWHLDAWHNQFRFVRNGSTVPAYVDSDGMHGTFKGTVRGTVYGAKFTGTILYPNSKANSTAYSATSYTIDSVLNYEWITILGGVKYTRAVATFHSSEYSTWCNSNYRLVLSSDAEYISFYFNSPTSIVIKDKSSSITDFKIIGYK